MKYLFAILAGLLNTVQSGANATLEGELKAGPTVPALVVYAGGILDILVADRLAVGCLGVKLRWRSAFSIGK